MAQVISLKKIEVRPNSLVPVIPTAILGMSFFLMTELMFFIGLISAFLVLRESSIFWPPADQPRLPVGVTGFNTILLLCSAGTILSALRKLRGGNSRAASLWLLITAVLGSIFLVIQGVEWARLISYGLTTSSSTYGGTFYLLVGAHALHVIAAVVVLMVANYKLRTGSYDKVHAGFIAVVMYWCFVVALWPILYALIYF